MVSRFFAATPDIGHLRQRKNVFPASASSATSPHQGEGLDLTDSERKASVMGLLSNREYGGIWIIFDGALPAGYIAICKGYSIEFCGFDAFIDEFYIRPESRGRGLGTMALKLAKIEAKKMGIRALHLEVALSNRKARDFYAAESFRVRDGYALMSADLD